MNTIEEFFKNRVSFTADPLEGIVSKQIFNPEGYSLDFLKEKTKSICYFLQNISFNDANFIYIFIAEKYEDEVLPGELLDEHEIIETHCCRDFFTKHFENCFENQKTRFLYKIPTKPFHIVIRPLWWRQFPYPSRWDLRAPFRASLRTSSSEVVSDEDIDVDSEEKEPSINTEQTFKSDECVICLTNPSNVLFCNYGHLCLCVECDKTKRLKNCPICKTENTIKRTV